MAVFKMSLNTYELKIVIKKVRHGLTKH